MSTEVVSPLRQRMIEDAAMDRHGVKPMPAM
jgi:hypothetical protein